MSEQDDREWAERYDGPNAGRIQRLVKRIADLECELSGPPVAILRRIRKIVDIADARTMDSFDMDFWPSKVLPKLLAHGLTQDAIELLHGLLREGYQTGATIGASNALVVLTEQATKGPITQMRINVYSDELTPEVHVIEKHIEETGNTYVGVRLFMKSHPDLHHTENDDDRTAITFWFESRAIAAGIFKRWAEVVERAESLRQLSPHEFEGRSDRWCTRCNLPDRHPIHTKRDLSAMGLGE